MSTCWKVLPYNEKKLYGADGDRFPSPVSLQDTNNFYCSLLQTNNPPKL
uniref:Uncharacterized protein n=1 Tax=Salmo trutta TaxID=8032 RepID=A0A673ZF22_SALTR